MSEPGQSNQNRSNDKTMTRERRNYLLHCAVFRNLKSAAFGLAMMYVVLACFHAITGYFVQAQAFIEMACLTAASMIAVWYVVKKKGIHVKNSHAVAATMCGLVLANILVYSYLTGETRDTLVVSFLTVGVGCLFLSISWLTLIVAVINISFFFVLLQANDFPRVLDFAYVQVGATALSFFLCHVRIGIVVKNENQRRLKNQKDRDKTRAHRLLQEKEERIRLISESIPISVFETDDYGKCTFTNSHYRNETGISLEELIETPWEKLLHPNDREAGREMWKRVLVRELPESEVLRFNHKKHHPRWGQLSLTPVCSECGILVVGAFQDITERVLSEMELKLYADDMERLRLEQDTSASELSSLVEELASAKRFAETSARSKSEFLANMSHEIRTPMTAILGYTDLLIERFEENQEEFQHLHTIQRNGEYLLQIINDILDLSKIEAGKMQVEKIKCSPHSLLDDVITLMQVRASEKSIPVKVVYPASFPEYIQSDPTRLRQILINLLGNSIKFTHKGEIVISPRIVHSRAPWKKKSNRVLVQKAQRESKTFLLFEVKDSGIGMNEGQLDKLFHSFTQADSSTTRKFGGTGLGLTISRRLVQMLGGDIVAESQEGVGSTFRFTINVGNLHGIPTISNYGPNRPPTVDATEEPQVSTEKALANLKVLLAEDGVDNQRLISFILKKLGASIDIAENGQVAVDFAWEKANEGNPYDVILMDMSMPVLDGYDATKKLREDGYSFPIIALTAHAMQSDRKKCLDAGCDEYATKPVNKEALVEKITGTLEKFRSLQLTRHHTEDQ